LKWGKFNFLFFGLSRGDVVKRKKKEPKVDGVEESERPTERTLLRGINAGNWGWRWN
jgi:hypothetical protein